MVPKLALYALGGLIAVPLVIATGLAAGALVLLTTAARASEPALGRLQGARRRRRALAPAPAPASRAALTGESSAA